MNYYVLIIVFCVFSCRENTKNNSKNLNVKNFEAKEKEYQRYTHENGFVRMSEISVKELLTLLRVKDYEEKELNILTTVEQTKVDWLTNEDLEYLILQIKSKEKAKCINQVVSSYIPDAKNMTIGNQVIAIIEAYRKGVPYPNELYQCEIYDKEKVNEILKWWKQKNDNS